MKVLTIFSIVCVLALTPLFSKGQAEQEQQPPPENSMMMMADEQPGEPYGSGPFIRYENLEQVMMLAGNKPTVLFFNASWCPDCRAARDDFTANSDALAEVNLIIVDYDNSDELQARYGVTYQHSFVQIDSSGDALATWNGGATEELLEHIVEKEM
jgi:thiol-disulfide isomerase/thioredoxin